MYPSSPQRGKMEIENEVFEKRRKISGSEISDSSFPSNFYGQASFNESGPDGFKTQFNQLNLSDSPKQQYVAIPTKKESYEKLPSIIQLQQIINNKDKITQFDDFKNLNNNLSQSQLQQQQNSTQNGNLGGHRVIKPKQIKNESTRNSSRESQNIENIAGKQNNQIGATQQNITYQNNINNNNNNNNINISNIFNNQNQINQKEVQQQNNLFNFILPSIFQTPLNFESIIQETEIITNQNKNVNLDPQSVMQMMEAKRLMTKLGFNFDNFYNQKFNLEDVNLNENLNQKNQINLNSQNLFKKCEENQIDNNMQNNKNSNNYNIKSNQNFHNISGNNNSFNFNQSLESLGGSFNFNQNLSNLSGYSNSLSNNSSIQNPSFVSGEKMIGNLTENERRDKVEKYLEKKKQRKWKNIRYKVRQNLADNRQRQQGRFVKSNNPRFNIDIYDKNLMKSINKDLLKTSDILENHSCPPQVLKQQLQQQHKDENKQPNKQQY